MPNLDSTRPEGVKVTTALMTAFLIAELALSLFTMHRMAGVVAGSQGAAFHMPSALSGGFSFISILIAAVFVYLFWQGSNVGRWAVLIDSGLVILSAILSVFSLLFMHSLQAGLGLGPVLYLGAVINVLKACLAGYFFWYLNQPAVKAWFLRSNDVPAGYPPAGYTAPYASQPPSPYAPTEPVPPTDPPTGGGFSV